MNAVFPVLHVAAASGNVFGYLWKKDAPPGFDGPSWARSLCPRGHGFGLDGIFLLDEPCREQPWRLEHWDADGAATFCSNGTRAALALQWAPRAAQVPVESNGEAVLLRRDDAGVGIRMPEAGPCGFHSARLQWQTPWIFGWIGNPQLVIEVAKVDEVDLPAFAPPLRGHAAFAGGTNVNVVEVAGPGRARIRSWERGVEGETQCCGTGCAVAGAWLAARGGGLRWVFQTAGRDPVIVTVGEIDENHWKDLWLSGPVVRIGAIEPDAALWSAG